LLSSWGRYGGGQVVLCSLWSSFGLLQLVWYTMQLWELDYSCLSAPWKPSRRQHCLIPSRQKKMPAYHLTTERLSSLSEFDTMKKGMLFRPQSALAQNEQAPEHFSKLPCIFPQISLWSWSCRFVIREKYCHVFGVWYVHAIIPICLVVGVSPNCFGPKKCLWLISRGDNWKNKTWKHNCVW
jgi:hypothetical protein